MDCADNLQEKLRHHVSNVLCVAWSQRGFSSHVKFVTEAVYLYLFYGREKGWPIHPQIISTESV